VGEKSERLIPGIEEHFVLGALRLRLEGKPGEVILTTKDTKITKGEKGKMIKEEWKKR